MRKILLVVSLSIFFSAAVGQISIPKLLNPDTVRQMNYDSALTRIINHSQVSVLFRTFSAWSPYNKNYKVISYDDNNKWHYYYQIDDPAFKGFFLSSMSEDSVSKIWNTCIKNNLFTINNEDLSTKKCEDVIYDSHHYEFTIITREEFKKISYYSPEFFESRCSSTKERKQVIACATAFKKLIRK